MVSAGDFDRYDSGVVDMEQQRSAIPLTPGPQLATQLQLWSDMIRFVPCRQITHLKQFHNLTIVGLKFSVQF